MWQVCFNCLAECFVIEKAALFFRQRCYAGYAFVRENSCDMKSRFGFRGLWHNWWPGVAVMKNMECQIYTPVLALSYAKRGLCA